MASETIGTFYLVGTPIGNMGDITKRAIETLQHCSVLMCEDTRETKKLLGLLEISLGDKKIISVREQNEQAACDDLISFLNDGKDVAYTSDAGMPAISDPGARLVAAVHQAGLTINVVPGPSAVTSAVALSGFSSTAFSFKGFFPRKEAEQLAEIKVLTRSKEITVYFESPNRLLDTLKMLSEYLPTNQRLVVAREITKKFEETFRGPALKAYEHFKNGVKGECVLVVEQASDKNTDASDSNIEEALKLLIDNGVSSKDTIEIVSLLTSKAKNDLKETYNNLKR